MTPDVLIQKIIDLQKEAQNMPVPVNRPIAMINTKLDEARLWAEELKRVCQ